MSEELTPSNQVRSVPSLNKKYYVLWRGETVYENGRIKEFESEADAWNYLAQCDATGRLIS
jgi:hypothetical protein